jgi:site-specific recombinase XerD
MVNRDNYKLVKKYMAYVRDVLQHDEQTVDRAWCSLRHLLEWTDRVSLANVRKIRPVLPRYLVQRDLSLESQRRACNTAKAFFEWLKEEHPRHYVRITSIWLDTLRPAKQAELPRERDVYSLDDIRQIAALPAKTLAAQRDVAAVAMLFLSGMRIGAFTSLTLDCVDLEPRAIKQWPELGVRTKNKKRATTYLLNMPGLLHVIKRWDKVVRAKLPGSALWYAPLVPAGVALATEYEKSWNRRIKFSVNLRRLCEQAAVKYRSPHKLRHSHAVYALGLAKDMADFKAISQNLMHSDLKTTDGIYNILKNEDLMTRIGGLTK